VKRSGDRLRGLTPLPYATGDPEDGFEHCVRKLTALIERDDAEVFASNRVIGEAYVALQHHYGVSKPDACAACAGRAGFQDGVVVARRVTTGYSNATWGHPGKNAI
jgi:hypothetical protein